jgi:tripartite-type tricarboxylate transporter receptor subunit TctC
MVAVAREEIMGRRIGFFAAALIAVLTVSAAWPAAASFYSGKRLTILVNFDAGGPNDIEGRLIARHWAKHIPGNPQIIVQNMGGAGGMIGARWLGEKAPRDGTLVGYLTGAPQRYALTPEKFATDLRNYEYVAYMPNGRIHFVRTDVGSGIKSALDLIKADGVVAGGLSNESAKDMAMRLVLDLLGVRYKYVTGYNATTRGMLAFQRGEVNLWSDSPSIYINNVEPVFVKAGQALPICYDPYLHNGALVVPKQMRTMSIISCPDLLTKAKGAMPKGEQADAYLSLLAFAGVMYRTMVLPPDVPKEAVTVLRAAMLALNTDAEYQEEATRIIGEAPEYIAGTDINEEAKKLMTIAPQLKQFLNDYAIRSH